MSEVSFNLSSEVLKWARVSMGYSIEQAAKKAGVPIEKYEDWENGEKKPTYKQLEKLAETVYKRPLAVLLLPTPPYEEPIQHDFRNLNNSEIEELSPELRLVLRKAKRYQLILEEVAESSAQPTFLEFNVNIGDDPKSSALRFRQFLGLSIEEQKSWSNDKAFNNFKAKIESVGIYIFHFKIPFKEARAFCLGGKFPIIVLNTEDSSNGRIFSLIHETCHLLFNVNGVFKDVETGTLNQEYSEIENFCNKFAASFLVPDDYFNADIEFNLLQKIAWSDDKINQLAKAYNVSNEVIARKLLMLKLISNEFFWLRKRNWDAIAKAAKLKANERLKEKDQGRAQDIKIIYEKGKPYVTSVVTAYQLGTISSSDLSNYLEAKLDHLPKLIQRISN
jgi:Zn-dependent peptidase ImmA (M78 family)/DNA-binding XRE family transcriptional regulator